MVSPFDDVAWIDHASPIGIEVVMPNTPRSNAVQRPNAIAHADSNPDGFMRIVLSFHEEAKDAHKWTPQERKERIDACSAKLMSYRQAEDAEFIEETSRIVRQKIADGKIGDSVQSAPAIPAKKKMSVKQLVDEIAANIQFG